MPTSSHIWGKIPIFQCFKKSSGPKKLAVPSNFATLPRFFIMTWNRNYVLVIRCIDLCLRTLSSNTYFNTAKTSLLIPIIVRNWATLNTVVMKVKRPRRLQIGWSALGNICRRWVFNTSQIFMAQRKSNISMNDCGNRWTAPEKLRQNSHYVPYTKECDSYRHVDFLFYQERLICTMLR